MSLAEMTVREVQPGQFIWAWGAPAKSRPIAEDLRPLWPEGCVGDASTVRCPDGGMVGTLAIDGVGDAYSAAIVRIIWRGGDSRVYTITQGQPRVRLFGKAQDDRGLWEVALTYSMLGVEHILSGFDHLLFVLSVLLLVGFNRRLIATVTSFTVAHSLTLAASALGALSLRSPPVETVIALSIVLVSAEALNHRETLTRRWPAVVAFVFGLVHGLGFAGAIKEIGLPAQNVNVALLSFNVGVEAGQLLVIALAFAVSVVARRVSAPPMARQALLYGTGTMAVYWTFSRAATFFA
ncbi:MAG: HupE/UreJ family protein [Burkholderiaceae bacterium]|nr:HupE/UreJ family protein [Burkholderiaceae bacterium]